MNGEAKCLSRCSYRFPARGVSAYTPMPAKPVKGCFRPPPSIRQTPILNGLSREFVQKVT
jgi:hypothetical protein